MDVFAKGYDDYLQSPLQVCRRIVSMLTLNVTAHVQVYLLGYVHILAVQLEVGNNISLVI